MIKKRKDTWKKQRTIKGRSKKIANEEKRKEPKKNKGKKNGTC